MENVKIDRGGVQNVSPSEEKTWKLVNFCEFDKHAAKSYCAVHGVDESINLGDITKVDENGIDDFTMMTWGFPCTDISVSGKRKGFIDENGGKTRSGTYYDGIRILRIKKPQLSIIENVKALTSKKFKVELEEILRDLRSSGYNSYWEVLNAKDYGIPQNRERIFIISIRKDLDNGRFKFPEPINLKLKLRDLLESNVNKKFYMPDEKYAEFLETFHMDSTDDFQQVGYINNYNGDANRVYSDSVARTLKAEAGGGGAKTGWYLIGDKIRKLVPKECWRLMGFPDEAFEAAESAGASNTQLYKQAGNSIVVDVLFYIYKELYEAMPYLFDDLRLSSFFSGIGAFEIALDRLYESIQNQ